MQAGGSPPRPSRLSLIPMAVVAVGVLVLALVIRGNRTGAIVVQRVVVSSTTSHGGRTFHQRTISFTTITETSTNSVVQAGVSSNSFNRPGFEQGISGSRLELYDPIDNTVYVTTERAEQRAILAQDKAAAPPGATVRVGVGRMQAAAGGIGYTPGRNGWLSTYRPEGRAMINGRAALKLVQRSPPVRPRGFQVDTTVYVSPGSYAPIETVSRIKLPAMRATSTTRWQTYRVLPATAANKRLLSLTARHPHAGVVDNAMAFLHAGQSEIRTSTVRTG